MSIAAPHTAAPLDFWRLARMMICDLFALFGEPQDIARARAITNKARALMLTWLRATETVLRHLLLIEAAALLPSLPRGDTHARPNARPASRLAADACVSPHKPDAPETWRISFRCFVGDTHVRESARRPWTEPSRTCVSPTKPVDPFAHFFIDASAAAEVRAQKAAWLAEMNALYAATCANPRSPTCGGAVVRSATEGGAAPMAAALYATQPLAKRVEALLRVFNAPISAARRLAFRLRRAPARARLLLHVPGDIDRALDRDSVTDLHTAAATCWPPPDSS